MEHLSTLPEEFSLLRRELGKTTDRHYKSLRLLYENLPARSSQYSTLRPTTAYGRYHHLRDVARQAFDAPRSLDSRSVTRIGRGKATQERFRQHPALRPSQSCLRLFPPPSIWHPIADERRGEDIVGPWGCYRCPCRHPSPIARPGEGVG